MPYYSVTTFCQTVFVVHSIRHRWFPQLFTSPSQYLYSSSFFPLFSPTSSLIATLSTQQISMEKAKKDVALGGHITIRQVTSMDRRLDVRERMKKRYAFKKYPDEFNFRCKCIVVFQNLDGVDTMLFGLYVYEHDEKNPAPNTRTVYVSYLDSVYYMRPRRMRTYIYHEILIAYLDYVRKRGFSTAHIWACPPLKGDDYILYAKPEDQKTPRDDRLRQWYVDMLIECQKRGICGKVTNMYDLYFADTKNDATIVPYMEGDYFPAEVENIIKELEEGKGGKKAKEAGKKKKAKKAKKPGNRGGTRSTGYDEEAFKASGFQPEGQNQASLEEGGRDFVMAKLGETIHPMKESFLVAFLNWKGIAEENKAVPKAIAEFREKHSINVEPGEPAAEASIEYLAREAAKAAGEPVNGDGTEAKASSTGDDTDKKAETDDSTSKADDSPADGADKPADSDDKVSAEKSAEDAGDAKPADSQDEGAKADAEKEDDPTSQSKPSESPDKSSESSDDKNAEEKKDDGASSAETKDDGDKVDDGDKPSAKPDADGSKAAEDDKADSVEADKPDTSDKGDSDTPADVKMEDASESQEDEKKEGEPEANVDPAAENGPSNENEVSVNDAGTDDKKADDNVEPMDTDEKQASEEEMSTPEEKKEETSADDAKADEKASVKEEGDAAKPTADGDAMDVDKPSESNDADVKDTDPSPDSAKSGDNDNKANTSPDRGGKFAAMAAKKRDADGNIKADPDSEEKKDGDDKAEGKVKDGEKKKEEDNDLSVKDSKGRTVKVLDDDEEELDCEFLNNRQAFLNLCQGNHYQFDQLRRAKHSSMMVLWHLHNRDAPKFVQQCAICSREILQGFRYHCPTCADFDQCEECLRNPATPRHPHQLKPIPVASGQQQQMSEEQRKERQRSIQLHMTLLLHAATCQAPKCPSANCTKMKGLLKHGASCQVKAQGGCHVCKRIWALLQIHARQCKAQQCPVPNCMAIRERFRQLRQQQMAMDDRRRQEMNRAYRR